jgi:DNA-binding NarL/FixJ family response regulator
MDVAAEKKLRLRLLLAVCTRELKTAFYLALSSQPAVQVVASATNTAEILSFSRTFRPDAIALEWEIPGRPVADLLPLLAQIDPPAEILVISRPSSREQIQDIAPDLTVFDDPEALIGRLDNLQAV